ncbi:MAG: adenosylcobalamin-dependent ribonucleoside-diphosphate reductase [Cloacibacillus porcorum]|uniref:adenosylcobalamin-dependent ribonucleoside-diphosphate reductase n=1 Tax=Cloacibacillus porcorum TaxID=1197717 RepID=UPI0023F0F199|nr:adenosylcobalamin-dependent ribonucleoside-diphosphate reductase [Cloacibacillus porcorum]MCD7876125.1 adenosylcobalamin-dependent ribonucleoside-diphosphate reductase [Cloacibacillus porcorum]
MKEELKQPNFSPLALDILRDRYLWRDANGNVTETPQEMLYRVAKHVSSAEKPEERDYWTNLFYNLMADLDFLPNSPTLMNAGRPYPHGQLAACFVVGIEDSMESICGALRKQMLIHKTGGGTGFNFSKLRPKNSTVNSTNGRASGPVSFMRLFDLSTEVIQQGGMRRGANMAILNGDHPDIEEFISCKDEEGKITNFNLSVGLTDEFMRRAVLDPASSAAALLRKIAEHAWRSGDPGVVFLDAINRDNPCPELGKIEATTPCGESPLLPDEACNLGSINLAHMVKNGKVNWDKLANTISIAVRFLDDVIDVNQYPLPEIEAAVKKTRKIGLGVMGWADMLYQLRIPYDSDEAVELARDIMLFISETAWCETTNLAKKKGPSPCPHWACGDTYHLVRNATVTCIAPTGTLSLLAGCSSGIEPVFANYHIRKVTLGDGTIVEKEIFNPYYEALVADKSLTDEQLETITKTAYQIPWVWHIRHQVAFQQYTDLAVSKTINTPHDATVDDVVAAYIMAWTNGCKGTTVYRDGSRSSQVLTEAPVRCKECEM